METATLVGVVLLVVTTLCAGPHGLAADWDPNDNTFDPKIQSVVIGNRSWLGDPSPFVHVESSRTGYTHVNATNYPNLDPAVVISLMVPLNVGETKPPAGGMLMLDQEQSAVFIKSAEQILGNKESAKEKKRTIKTMLEGATWTMIPVLGDSQQRAIRLENKTDDKVFVYQFSANATKKLIGAIRHSVDKLAKEEASKKK